jgi:hypothetical protein
MMIKLSCIIVLMMIGNIIMIDMILIKINDKSYHNINFINIVILYK